MPNYEILAIKYAEARRPAAELFLHPDPHESGGLLYYYVWLIRGEGRTILVDTGFGTAAAEARGRHLSRLPSEALEAIGIAAASIREVVITHLHYDHAGNLDSFPNARFYLQTREMAAATGPDMCHRLCRTAFAIDDVISMVRHVYADRVTFVEGDHVLGNGIGLHLLGGHTRGLQGVLVRTKRGAVMLASDALHLYRNLGDANPFPIFVDLPGVLEAGRRALSLADSGDHLIPGHDPLVLAHFPAMPGMDDIAIVSEPPLRPAPLAKHAAGPVLPG